MTQQEFLKSLKEELERHRVQNIQDVLADYEEHFRHGLNKRKTEEEISQGLGFPATIAKAYQTENMINEIKNPQKGFQLSLAINVIGRLLLIAPFNFFVLFIPGVVIFALMVAGWTVALALGSVSIAILAVLPTVGALAINDLAVDCRNLCKHGPSWNDRGWWNDYVLYYQIYSAGPD